MLTFGDFHYRDCLYVARNMREMDREEIAAVRWDDADPEQIAIDCEKAAVFSYIVYLDGEPVAVLGASPLGPGVATVYMFATDKFSAVGLGLTKWAKRVYEPFLKDCGFHRVECHTISTHPDSHKWLRFFGATHESDVPAFGKNREMFCRYAAILDT